MPSGAALTCLQLLLLLSAVDSRPHTRHQDRFQLEAVKKEILERLGMSAPPVPRRPLDQESIQRAQRLYQLKVAELAGNRSREGEEEEEAVSGTRRLHRLTPTCKCPWLRATPRASSPRDTRRAEQRISSIPQAVGDSPGAGAWQELIPSPGWRGIALTRAVPSVPAVLRWLDTPEGHQDPEGHRDSPGHREPRGPHRYHLLLSRTADFHRQLRVLQAELKLFKQPLSPPGASVPPRVTIYTLRGAEGTPQLLLSRELDRDSRSLELTGAIQPWLAGPEATLRLRLDFSADVSAALDTSGGETLVLEVETQEKPARAARRARGLEEECGKSDGRCCLKSLKVSFQDIGWSDWVIAPSSYHMRFCEGSCPHNYKPASMHAQIKSRVHSLSKATPPPCCVPAGYDPMVLMHLDSEGRLVSSLFEDMLVTRCHCA
ncbi:growth/differentiation factor 15 [Cyanistes caeruleus]|uniref:growth/differentiation factor 15 n=1 Tax=Cyanistes caeruleus TaxID=156563 RepID=UPI000CDA37C0|nr:growth/differentiation factor 15 [Cyanistes caeruleus]